MRHILLLTAASLTIATAARANDSTASTGAGGLVIEKTDAIDMVSEDLFVSAEEIRVHYVFRNSTATPVDAIVAFPMPDRDLAQEYGGDVAYPSGFRTKIAGVPARAALERKAMIKGVDHTALLKQLGIPLAPDSINAAVAAMDRLPPSEKKRLVALGLAGDEEYDDTGQGMKHHLIPLWAVADKYWWQQRFPAGRDLIIDHRYVPGVGSNNGTGLHDPDWRKGPEYGQREIAQYCIDREFLAGIDKFSGAADDALPEYWIDYVLTTGANWRSPIGSFRLVVDKGKPGNLVSFCESGVKKISPTQFEVRHTNWRPTRDLHVLIIEPAG